MIKLVSGLIILFWMRTPPALALTSRLAPEGRIGRYMGIFGFSLAAGWSLGPQFGGLMLQFWRPHFGLAWISIASLALIAAIGYVWFSRGLPEHLDRS